MLNRVGIEGAMYLMPDQLSGGMQRRVAIARALAGCRPRMMLYDEPTSGLDPLTADTICDLINELSSGDPTERTGLIIVTHDVADAVKVAERFMYLRNGRIQFDGDLEALKSTQDAGLNKFIKDIL
jgi:phospholipid/cholesterol/gamma-HCH transport system ATP-binding protein